MTKWEYTQFEKSMYDGVQPSERLAKLGLDGWELVSVLHIENYSKTIFYFKRPVHEIKNQS